VSTTGEQYAYFALDADLHPQPAPIPEPLKASADLIAENCEPSVCSVLFMGGAGGSLRAGVTENPVRLTKSVKDSLTYVSCGGAEAYVWPGGGITVMVDVLDMPTQSFGYVPTPALVAPIEFTMRVSDYAALGGHTEEIRPVDGVVSERARKVPPEDSQPDPMDHANYRWAK
ncbi:6-hydroxynicotinate reductase, partial [Cribrihabitans sp. XS_ASV171]